MLTPADTVTVPAASSIWTASCGGLSAHHVAAGVLGRVAVRAAEAAGDPAAMWQVLDRRRQAVLVDGRRARTSSAWHVPSPASKARRDVVEPSFTIATTLQTVSTATRARPGRPAAAPCRARA